jgi:hypothetical protein
MFASCPNFPVDNCCHFPTVRTFLTFQFNRFHIISHIFTIFHIISQHFTTIVICFSQVFLCQTASLARKGPPRIGLSRREEIPLQQPPEHLRVACCVALKKGKEKMVGCPVSICVWSFELWTGRTSCGKFQIWLLAAPTSFSTWAQRRWKRREKPGKDCTGMEPPCWEILCI